MRMRVSVSVRKSEQVCKSSVEVEGRVSPDRQLPGEGKVGGTRVVRNRRKAFSFLFSPKMQRKGSKGGERKFVKNEKEDPLRNKDKAENAKKD